MSSPVPNDEACVRESLDEKLANRQWLMCERPFRHVIADSVFRPDVYGRIQASFLAQLEGPVNEKRRGAFARTIPGYDAYVSALPDDPENALQIFRSPEWCRMLANLFIVNFTGDVSVELHHHVRGSPSGRIHNDLNPGWFVGESSYASVNLVNNRVCSYRYGRCADSTLRPRRVARGVAMIYYIANRPWRAGAGGETGLYETASDVLEKPAAAVSPINNSLVAFECTPWSFHSFLGNTASERNAIVLWVHRPYEEVAALWGEHAIVDWPRAEAIGS